MLAGGVREHRLLERGEWPRFDDVGGDGAAEPGDDQRRQPAGEGEEWVDFDGATYVEHEGEVELLPGIRLLPAPGHTDGHQVVIVETDAGTNVLGGDVGTSFHELGSGTTEGQRRVLALGAPTWLSHAPGPKSPEHRP